MRRRTALLLASLLAVAATAGGASLRSVLSDGPRSEQAAREQDVYRDIVSDRIDEAVAGLETSPLWVAPELAEQVDEATRNAVERELEAAPVPTYLVYWTETTQGGYGTTQAGALDAMLLRLGSATRPARVALVTQDRSAQLGSVGEERTFSDPSLLGGRLGPGLERYAAALAAEESEPLSESSDDTGQFNLVGGDYYGGLAGGGVLGVLLGGSIAGGLFVVVRFVVVPRRSARSGARGE